MILELEKQVCSLESAKRLKELGFPQESLFYWSNYWFNFDSEMGGWEKCREIGIYSEFSESKDLFPEDWIKISAYTVAELGELLPPALEIDNPKVEKTNAGRIWTERAILVCGKFRSPKPLSAYYCDYHIYRPQPFVGFELYKGFKSDREAEARAKMLIYLSENNLIKQDPELGQGCGSM